MAKQKLKKFVAFCNDLLPHETTYLKDIFESLDKDKVGIISRIHHNTHNPSNFRPFDLSIDKRKYSKILIRVRQELEKIDVDRKIAWIAQTHRNILLDRVSEEDDKQIISALQRAHITDYNFLQFYEMLVQYRHFLLIRMRYQSHQRVDTFINRHQYDYKRSKLINEQMHQATSDIIGTSDEHKHEAIQWSKWLLENFTDERLDGLTKYMSAIRYIFICLRYNWVEELEHILLKLDQFLKNPNNYSKRLLVNYYNNLSILYDQKNDFKRAKYFGFLSIRYEHPDRIIYTNNLVNILIKMEDFQHALDVIDATNFSIKRGKNFHSTIGFVSNHIRCLFNLQRHKEAVTKGRIFLNAYSKQILRYRWHRFFAAYHGALLLDGKNKEIIKNTISFDLIQKEQANFNRQNPNQILNIYYQIALYRNGELGKDTLRQFINKISKWEYANYESRLETYLVQLIK